MSIQWEQIHWFKFFQVALKFKIKLRINVGLGCD